jgi:microcystin-dependent protein
MWSNGGRSRLARLVVLGALIVISGCLAGGLASAAAGAGQRATDQLAAIASSHNGQCNWIGQALLVGFTFAPAGTTLPARGQLLQVANHVKLYTLIGNTFGGNPGVTFGLPDLRGKAPTGLHYVICTHGAYPNRAGGGTYGQSCNYQGQVVLVSFAFSPVGTVAARGELQSTSQYPLLFMRLGYSFGGTPGSGMFGVPDLRGQAPGGLHYRICTSGEYPTSQSPHRAWCNWLGQIILSSFNVSSLLGTLPARGQILQIGPNEALFSLLGNAFGGNVNMFTFALPKLNGKAPHGLHYLVCTSAGAFPPRA